MNNRRSRSLMIHSLLVIMWVACGEPARCQSLAVEADAYVNSQDVTGQFGAAGFLAVADGGALEARSFVRFDLSSLPGDMEGTDVEKAFLRLWVNNVITEGSVDAHILAESWLELGIDFVNQPLFLPTSTGSEPIVASDKDRFISIDVTSSIRSWIDGSEPNHGLVLLAGQAGTKVVFDSKENTETAREPTLIIQRRPSTVAMVKFDFVPGSTSTPLIKTHGLGRRPDLIEALLIEHNSPTEREASGNWSTGQWHFAGGSPVQQTQTHHGSANIQYDGAILHVANNPTRNFSGNHYARLSIASVTKDDITFNFSRNGSELDPRLMRVVLILRK